MNFLEHWVTVLHCAKTIPQFISIFCHFIDRFGSSHPHDRCWIGYIHSTLLWSNGSFGFLQRQERSVKKDKKKKSSLMDKLRSPVNAIKGNASRSGDENDEVDDAHSSFENSRRKKLKGNKNAEKTTRMIELSCYHLGEVTVEFFESSGFTRSPIAHTCDRVLKVPLTYENYPPSGVSLTTCWAARYGLWT